MKVGVSTASLFLRQDNEDAVATLNALGVEVAEVFLTSFSEYKPSFGRLLAERKGELCVHSVHILNTQIEPQLFNRHHRVREDSYAALADVMTTAQILGAPCVHVERMGGKGRRKGAPFYDRSTVKLNH